MGLLSVLRKLKEREKEMRILVLGLDCSGKTTFVKQLLGEDITVIQPTLGFSIYTFEHRDGYKLTLWDVGGQSTIRSYWRNYFEETDAIIWVVDSSDLRRLDECAEQLHEVLKEERLLGASLLVFGNKQDLPGAMSPDEISLHLHLEGIKSRHWEIVGSSAKDGTGLSEGIDWAVDEHMEEILFKFMNHIKALKYQLSFEKMGDVLNLEFALEQVGDDMEFLIELLEEALQDWESRQSPDLKRACAEEDPNLLQEVSHDIKGVSSNLGLNCIQECASKLSSISKCLMGKDGVPHTPEDQAKALVDRGVEMAKIKDEFKRFEDHLRGMK